MYEYAHIRPLMVRLYCPGDSQYSIYFMAKTADADVLKLRLDKISSTTGSLRSAGQHSLSLVTQISAQPETQSVSLLGRVSVLPG